MASISLQRLIDKMKLKNLTEEIDINKIKITQPDINRPAIQLTGYLEHYDSTRLQIVGFVEYTYMQSLSPEQKAEIYDRILNHATPAFVFCRELEPDPLFKATAVKYGVPILGTSKATSAFMAEVIRWLNAKLAPCIQVHGVLVDIYGEGVLITGESGIGKSEAAIELIKRGHRLVSDDAVLISIVFSRMPDTTAVAATISAEMARNSLLCSKVISFMATPPFFRMSDK